MEYLQTKRVPYLRKISAKIEEPKRTNRNANNSLKQLFCPKKPRGSVTELRIQIETSKLKFEPEYLDRSFPNLVRLSLKLDDHTRIWEVERFIELISFKCHLKELTLSIPGENTDMAFRGGNRERISDFLRLVDGWRNLRLPMSTDNMETVEEWEWAPNGMLGRLSRMSLTRLHVVVRNVDNLKHEWFGMLVKGPLSQSLLRVRLDLLGTDLRKHYEFVEMLERLAHTNRFAKGLTSLTYEQFKETKESLGGKQYAFRSPE